jgi:hypothetical protein
MSLKERKFLYNIVEVDNNKELDYLSDSFIDIELRTSTSFSIPITMRYRPDLISLKFYNNYHLGWLLAKHNGLLDPIFDFEYERQINIPDLDSYFRYYKSQSRRR